LLSFGGMKHVMSSTVVCALVLAGCTDESVEQSGASSGNGAAGPTSAATQGSGGNSVASSGSGGGATSSGTGGGVPIPVRAGEWFEVVDSHMDAVKHNVDGPNMWDVTCVISCWCGGAYDSKRDRLVVWGGGHGQYSGNELYAFNMDTLAWERLTDPSNPPGVDVPYAPDGNPTSRHSYNYLQYLPATDRFYSLGGAAFYPGGQTGTDNVDAFNFDTSTWETNLSSVPSGAHGYAFSAVDASTGHAYQQGPYSSGAMARYDAPANVWTPIAVSGASYINSGFTATAAFDPKRQKMVAVGDGITMWDISGSSAVATNPTTSGDNSIETEGAVGLDYDPVTETFIAWAGGPTIYSLNIDTMEWTTNAPTGPDPGSESVNHTYGRFRYVPSKNVFVVVNASDRNVFIYKHTPELAAPQWYLDMIASP
jgi:hypothetical protein